MKILFVQDHLQAGGAAKCALRMQRLCRELGHETLALHGDETRLPGCPSLSLHGKPKGIRRLWEKVRAPEERQAQRRRKAGDQFRRLLQTHAFDLVWFHNLAGARKWGWTEEWIESALARTQVAITLHDMEYLGVGSPYVWDQPLHPSCFAGLEPSRAQELARKEKLRITACSRWLGQLCLDLYGLSCGQLPVPLWKEDFSEGENKRRSCPATRYLMASEFLDDPRKNILPTIELLLKHNILEQTHSSLICLGRNFPEKLRGPRVLAPGHVEDRESFRKHIQQADFLLHPSLLDNFPLLIQESLAQGCPVVALDRGGVREMVMQGRSGFLLREITAQDLASTFQQLSALPDREYDALSAQCLSLATDLFRADRISRRYQEFFKLIRN